MATSSISATSASSASTLNIQDFLRILTTQLNNQDPLKPMDNQEFIAQLAQFTTLQQTQEMNQKLASLLSIQSANQSIGLIGRTVDVQTDSGTSTGQVSALGFASGEPRLTITLATGATLTDVSLSSLINVR
jgi:flagellar basal-body rod modification protein FlgD